MYRIAIYKVIYHLGVHQARKIHKEEINSSSSIWGRNNNNKFG